MRWLFTALYNFIFNDETMTLPLLRNKRKILIIFGRPGAGKSTIAAVSYAKLLEDKRRENEAICTYLDLDDCVPQWMKDNFSKGIYPTLQQRTDFAHGACEYVRQKLLPAGDSIQQDLLISFSFVNKDLRDVFREEFPDALWILVNTPEDESQKRIAARQGHFYHGANSLESKTSNTINKESVDDWQFDPVTFPHISLDGFDPIQNNSDKVVDTVLSM